ncbi:lamin tail domain-containing protein [Candidatus Woesearchaeota archaeon]|nr:lamin tail domain-containing protein [Candidatus Woesearchaeota archaeon]
MKKILGIVLATLVICLVVVLISTSAFATTAQGTGVLNNPILRLWNAIHNLQGQINSGELQALALRVATLEGRALPDCIIDADCDDNDPCTNQECNPVSGCVFTENAQCDDVSGAGSSTGITSGEVIITEFMYNPNAVTDTYGEWLELYNAGEDTVNLNGWSIQDEGTDSYTFSEDLIVIPGEYVVLCKNTDSNVNGGISCDVGYSSFTLGNTADSIILLDGSSGVVDQVSYDVSTAPWDSMDNAGYSLQLGLSSHDAASNDNGGNWCNAAVSYGLGDYGTPGEINSGC